MEKRKIAQASRLKSKDAAQNRGGSRPFAETTIAGMKFLFFRGLV
jgi:hypothetical protein